MFQSIGTSYFLHMHGWVEMPIEIYTGSLAVLATARY